MIVDSSALVAILRREPEADDFLHLVAESDTVRISAATYLEAAIVVDMRRDPALRREFDDLVKLAGIIIEPVTAEQAVVAREAYRDYGRGSGHPAGLNFGDCFSYALARTAADTLLYKGDDFVHTDLRAAAAARG